MRSLLHTVLTLAILTAGIAFEPAAVEAASATTCLCSNGQRIRRHHRYACEYDLKKPFQQTLGGRKPSKFCSSNEVITFKRKICQAGGCTYPY
jgi:hypothetical protein